MGVRAGGAAAGGQAPRPLPPPLPGPPPPLPHAHTLSLTRTALRRAGRGGWLTRGARASLCADQRVGWGLMVGRG
eukprot:1212198-Rhodomonas_salina.1